MLSGQVQNNTFEPSSKQKLRKGRGMNLKKILSSDWFYAILIFVVAVILRSIPEFKAGIWAIGYDTSNTYSAEIASYSGSLINYIKTANILYFLFLPFKGLGIPPDMIMKIFGPLLYGALGISFFLFLKKFLRFSSVKSLIVVIITILQFAALRSSWDLYRNELGLIFMFLALACLPNLLKKRYTLFFALLSGLVVLSNQLVTVLYLIILIAYLLRLIIKKDWENVLSVSISLIIIGILFTIVINSSGQVLYNNHVFFTSEKNYFWRYFYQYNQAMSYSLLREIISNLFWLLYACLIPTALIGMWILRKNIVLTVMTLFLLFGSFSSLIFFGNGLFVWERWMIMLVFPIVIYAVEGTYYIGGIFSKPGNWVKKIPALSIFLSAIFWGFVFGFFLAKTWPFLTATYSEAKPPLANDEMNSYFPRTMVHNAVGLGHAQDTVNVVKWLDKMAPENSVILVDNRYRGFMITNFDMGNRFIITNSWSESIQESNLETVKEMNLRPIYIIWNVTKAIPGFDRIYSSGSRGIYQALPGFYE